MSSKEISPTRYIFDTANSSMWRHDGLPCNVDQIGLYVIKGEDDERVSKKSPPKDRRILVVLDVQENLTDIYFSSKPSDSHKDLEEKIKKWTGSGCIILKGAIITRESGDEINKNKHDVFIYEDKTLRYQTIREIIVKMKADLLIFRDTPKADGIIIDVQLERFLDYLGLGIKNLPNLAKRIAELEPLIDRR